MRRLFDRRPALIAAAGLATGLTLAVHPLNGFVLLVLLVWLERVRARALLLTAAAVGIALTPAELHSIWDRIPVSGRGTVCSTVQTLNGSSRFDFDMQGRRWRALARSSPDLHLGDELEVSGMGLPLMSGSEERSLLHGITARLRIDRLRLLARGPVIWSWGEAWRRRFAELSSKWLHKDIASFALALSFDSSGEMDPGTTDRLRETGTIHIVSASGLHVFVLAYVTLALLARCPIPRSWQIAALALVLLIYSGATGLNPPVVRASLMCVVGAAAYLVNREPDALSALGIACVAYLLWQPREISDPGFQLSFVTVGAMCLFLHPPAASLPRWRRWLNEGLQASWVAWVASTPLVAYHFGTVSLSALPANLLISIPTSVAVIACLATSFVSLASPLLGVGVLAMVVEPCARWVMGCVEALSGHPWSALEAPAFPAYLLVLFYGSMLLTWRERIAQPA